MNILNQPPVTTSAAQSQYSPIELKVKAASLAAESRIIRNLELRLKRRATVNNKLRPGLRDPRNLIPYIKLHDHRTKEVRTEARATHLARAFLKGQPYQLLERKTYTQPPLTRAGVIVIKYSADRAQAQTDFKKWQHSAMEYYCAV